MKLCSIFGGDTGESSKYSHTSAVRIVKSVGPMLSGCSANKVKRTPIQPARNSVGAINLTHQTDCKETGQTTHHLECALETFALRLVINVGAIRRL